MAEVRTRRAFLSLVGASAIAGCSQFPAVGEQSDPVAGNPDEDWFQVAHDAGHTAHVPTAGGAPPIARWEFGPYEYVSSPIVVGESVYVTAVVPERGPFGGPKRDTRAVLFRIDESEGTVARVATSTNDGDGWSGADPIFYSGRFYLTSDTELFALDARTGRVEWRRDGVSGNPTPAAADNRIVAGCRNAVCAFDAETGTRLWSNPVASCQVVVDPPAIADGRVVYVENDGNSREPPQSATVRAVEADTGTEIWSMQTDVVSYGTPVLTDDTLYVANRRYVYALDAATGTRRWRASVVQPTYVLGPQLCVDRERVYVPENRGDHGRLAALSRADGEREWTLETRGKVGCRPVRTGQNLSLCVSGMRNRIVAKDFHASVLSLDPEGGERYWKFRLQGYSADDPVATGNSLYVTSGLRGEMSLRAFGY